MFHFFFQIGDINPENIKKATPLQESTLAGHLTVSEIVRKMTDLHKGVGKFDWGKILNNLEDPVEENLQRIMFINDSEALRAFLNNKNKTEVLAECIKVNQIGYNPLITAAEFLSTDSLLIVLQFLSKIAAIGTKEEKEKCAETLHGGQRNISLLSIVMTSDYFIGQIQLEVIECEGYLHDWSTSKYTACLQKRIGTNEISLKCRELFSKKNAEERGKTKMKICVISLTTLVLAIYKASPASFDIGTDVTLLVKYGSATSIEEFIQANCSSFNNTILLNNDHDAIKSWTITLEECFWITLCPVLLPCFFNFVQIVSFANKCKNKACNGLLKYSMVFLSPIWLVIAALGEATEEFKISSSNSNTMEEEEETLTVFKQEFADAKFTEVVSEATIQPILQLYLFLLPFLCSDINEIFAISLSCVQLWAIIQVLSFGSSLLSIPRVFTARYVEKKSGMMSTEAEVVYFLSILTGVISRILCLELLAFTLGQGNFSYIYLAIVCHVGLILFVNLFFSKGKIEDHAFKDGHYWNLVTITKNHILNAMACIYVQWSDGQNEGKDMKRQIIIEVILLVQNIVISVWASMVFLSPYAKTKVLAVIWGLYMASMCLKAGFFLFLHPWSEIVKMNLLSFVKQIFCSTKCCNKRKEDVEIHEMWYKEEEEMTNLLAVVKHKQRASNSYSFLAYLLAF